MKEINEKDLKNVNGGANNSDDVGGYITIFYKKEGLEEIFSYEHRTGTSDPNKLEQVAKMYCKHEDYIYVRYEFRQDVN